MLSVHQTSSDFRHDQVDIVANTKTLSKLLRFCKSHRVGTYRFFLRMIQGSLFLAPSLHSPGSDRSDQTALQSTLSKRCTEMPSGLEHSTHYRSVQYSLGHLNCVVQSKVHDLCSILPGEPQSPSSPSPVGPEVSQAYPPLSGAAMVQVRLEGGKLKGPRAEALWLSRTPFLLRARISAGGNITNVSKVDATSAAREWEKEETQQLALRKLATLLSDLKRAVKGAAAPDGQACIGLIEWHLDPPVIQVFLPEDKSAVPGDISNNPWAGKTSHGPDEASIDEGGDSTCQAKLPQDKVSSNAHSQIAQ